MRTLVSQHANIAPQKTVGKKRIAPKPNYLIQSVQVNVLSTFLLAFLLLPMLRKTTKLSSVAPRLVILSSGVHYWTDIPAYRDGDNIYRAMNEKESFNAQERYPASKLLDTLLTRELGNHLQASPHPEDQKISVSGYPAPRALFLILPFSHPLALSRDLP